MGSWATSRVGGAPGAGRDSQTWQYLRAMTLKLVADLETFLYSNTDKGAVWVST